MPSRVTSLRLTDAEYDAIQTIASEENKPLREIILDGIRERLARKEGKARDHHAEGYEQGRREGIRAVFTAYREEGSELHKRILKRIGGKP